MHSPLTFFFTDEAENLFLFQAKSLKMVIFSMILKPHNYSASKDLFLS